MAKHLTSQLALWIALMGAFSATVYLLAPHGYRDLRQCAGALGIWGSWVGTAMAVYCTYRYDRRRYIASLLIGLAGSAFWAWAIWASIIHS